MANDEVRKPVPENEQPNSVGPESDAGEISLEDADKVAGGPTDSYGVA